MPKTFKKIGCIVVFLLGVSAFVFAAQRDPALRVFVQVETDASLKHLITSYITRELRSLPDVMVVEEDPRWILSIVAMEVKTNMGRSVGVAISTVLLWMTPGQLVHSLVKEKYGSSGILEGMARKVCVFEVQWLNITSRDGPNNACSGIVAHFDSKEPRAPARGIRSPILIA